MTEPIHLSDRMPEVARGVALWAPEEEAHLTCCEECRAEWRVVQLGATVGADLTDRMDLAGIAARVVADRARRTPVPRVLSFRRASWVVATAAAAALLIMVARPSSAPESVPAVALLPELEGLSADELALVLDVLPAPDGWTVPGTNLGDLSDEELERVLGTLEG